MRREWYGSGTAEGEKGGRRPCDEEVGGLVNRPREGCGEGGGGGGGGDATAADAGGVGEIAGESGQRIFVGVLAERSFFIEEKVKRGRLNKICGYQR